MMISTTGDLCTFVLRASGINGVGQTPMAEDSNTCLQFLHSMLAQWSKKRWLTYVLQDVSVAASTGATSYTIGPGQQFDCARPDHIHAAYIRLLTAPGPQTIDIPVEIITSREEWSSISVKNLQTMPAAVFYESGWPTGRVFWWPVPPANHYGLFLTVKLPLPVYTNLTDPINLPPEYMEALVWSLCVRMQMAYGLPARPDHAAAMQQAMETIRCANAQIPQLDIPAPLGRRYSDVSLVGPGLGRAYILDSGPGLA